jgi:formylglycine-generating enzyme required for sulfatase activity
MRAIPVMLACFLEVACACGGAGHGASTPGGSAPMDIVPPGRAQLGCDRDDPGCPAFGVPRRSVDVAGFAIDRFEVTASDYAACVRAGACSGDASEGRQPIGVSQIDAARAYCGFRGKRLPTSVEWEKAARGVDGRPFPWGEAPPDCERAESTACAAGHDDVVGHRLAPVGSHPAGAGPYGTQDLAGNIGEWTECAGLGGEACIGIIRGSGHGGVDALRAYAGEVVDDRAIIDLLFVGFRCARSEAGR